VIVAAGAPSDSVLVFEVGSAQRGSAVTFGLEVLNVLRVIEIDAVASVPLAPLVVRGIINDKGRIVTIVDPAPLLGLEGQPGSPVHGIILKRDESGRGAMGLEASRVRGIVPRNDLEEVDVEASACVKRVAKLQRRLVHVIDVELLYRELRQQFGPSVGKEPAQGERI
jgi:chemotaxis signal transduction protein